MASSSLLYFNNHAIFDSFMNSRAFPTRIPSKRRKTQYKSCCVKIIDIINAIKLNVVSVIEKPLENCIKAIFLSILIYNTYRNTYDCKKYLNRSYHLKSDYFQGTHKYVSLKNNASEYYIKFIVYLQDRTKFFQRWCLSLHIGPNTVLTFLFPE